MTEQPRPHTAFWHQHFALFASAALTLLLALKILAVGHYNTQTALGIVQVAGTSNILLATLITTIPVATTSFFLLALGRWRDWYMARTHIEKATVALAASLPLTILLMGIVPLAFLGIFGASFGAVVLLIYLARRRASKTGGSDSEPKASRLTVVERGSLQASGIVVLLTVTVSFSWMPTETVSVNDGKHFTAYVVGERDDETILLALERDTGLITVPTQLLKRSFCQRDSWLSVSAIQALSEPAYPKCP